MKNKILSLCLSLIIVFGSVSFAFASSVTPSNFTPYLQSNSGYYWINPNNGYSSTVSSGTKLVDMIGQLGGNLSQGIYNILSKLSNTGRIYLYNYSGTNSSYNAGSSLGDLVGYGLQNLTQTNSFIYDKIDDLLTSVNSIKGYVDGVEGYIDGVETGLTSVNTNLTNIKSDTNSIKGYIDGLEQGQNDIVNAIGNISGTDLSTVHTYLNNIASDVELNEINTSGIDDTLDYIADQMFLSSSGTLADDIENILYSNRDILNGFGYSYGDTLKDGITGVLNVGSDIVSSVDNVHDVNSTISAISSNIQTIATSQMAIQSTISAINEGIHSDTTDLNSKLQTLTDNYNDIEWVNNGYTFSGFKHDLTDTEFIPVSRTYDHGFILFKVSNTDDSRLIKLHVPVRIYGTNDGLDLKFGYYLNGDIRYIDAGIIAIAKSNSYTDFIINPIGMFNNYSYDYFVSVSTDNPYINFNPAMSSEISYLSSDKSDFYSVQSYLFNFNFLDILRDAKFMFFDDDTIQAKKDNASQTSAVIDGFTSDGDASASASDFGAVKDGVSNVKSGIDTNVSASSAFGGFNSEEGYSFFSQTTLNNLDTTNSNRRLLRSNNDNNSAYDDRLNAIYDLMGVNHD